MSILKQILNLLK